MEKITKKDIELLKKLIDRLEKASEPVSRVEGKRTITEKVVSLTRLRRVVADMIRPTPLSI